METTEIRKSPVREMLGCALPIFWAGIICFSYPGIMTTYWQERYHVGSTETGLVLTFMLVGLAVSMLTLPTKALSPASPICSRR